MRQPKPRYPVALTIAGSDSGGGAGIQADLKTFAALGVHGLSAITALTAQNTITVDGVLNVRPSFVADQIDSLLDDFNPNATKTGMLASAPIVDVVAHKVREHVLQPLVVDPVLVSSSGRKLLTEDGLAILREQLLPIAAVVTPNVAEAQILGGIPVRSLEDMKEAARRIRDLGPLVVVVTGGHLADGNEAVDVFWNGSEMVELPGPRIESENTHGTGCTFASAIAAWLARGAEYLTAVQGAKQLVTEAIRWGWPIGDGSGPVDPMGGHFRRQRKPG